MRKLLFALAAPLLLVQGKRVRRTTPRLPEPPGPRQGKINGRLSAGKPTFSLLMLGDSAIAGVGCDSQTEALSGQLLALLSDARYGDQTLAWQLIAKSSLTCAQVLALLQQTELSIAAPNAVVVSVGVNDVTKRTPIKQWRADLEAMTRYLSEELGAKKVIYTSLPPMHKFPALPQPLRWFVGQQAFELNRYLAAHCQQHRHTELLQFDLPYAPEFIAADGYHPSAEAAKLWAQAAEKLI